MGKQGDQRQIAVAQRRPNPPVRVSGSLPLDASHAMRPSGIRTSAAWLKLSTSGPRPDRCPLLFGRKRTAGLTLVCPTCGATNRNGAKFCNECGGALSLACPACGAQHRAGQKFCDECGSALGAAPGSAGPAVVPTAVLASDVDLVVPELRFVSVLFVDLVGFTSLSESRAAEDVRELLAPSNRAFPGNGSRRLLPTAVEPRSNRKRGLLVKIY